MSKRAISSSNTNTTKRARKSTGFRVARPPPASTQAPTSTPNSNTSVFVTVRQPNETHGRLEAQTRVLESSVEASEAPSGPVTGASEPLEIGDDGLSESPLSAGVEVPEEELSELGQRIRHTRNAVNSSHCLTSLFCTKVPQDHLTEWLKYREIFLDEVLRHDGLGDFMGHTSCSHCEKGPGVFRCRDCAKGSMLKCSDCVLELHEELPLHRIEVGPAYCCVPCLPVT